MLPITLTREPLQLLRVDAIGYGAKDTGIPVATVDQMKAALKAANKPGEIIVYPEAGHGFNADYRPGYHKESAEDGWKRLLEWFKAHGVA